MELCQVAGVSRAGYYRFPPRVQESEADMDLRSAIQQIALEWPSYGYRRVHRELMRRGWRVNHKRVLRRMRVDNLLCLRKRNFILTTDSHHELPIYPNLAKDMVLTGINQLWIADITYIRLEVEFVYLAVVLDAFSRNCIGWALQRSLEAGLVLEALRMALRTTPPPAGLGAPFGPWSAIRSGGLHCPAEEAWYQHQHESARKCLRQCHGGEFYEDAQV